MTLGVPRLKEIIDATKNARTPCTTLRFQKPFSQSGYFSEYFSQTLPFTRLGDVVKKLEIIHDPDPQRTVVDADQYIVDVDAVLGPPPEGVSEHVVRLELDEGVMKARRLTPPVLRTLLSRRLADRAVVSSCEANSLDWILRIRFLHISEMASIGGLDGMQEVNICHRVMDVLLETVVVSGHPDVTSASPSQEIVPGSLRSGGQEEQEWVVHVYGSFLADSVSASCVDWYRSTSNDIWETYSTLGIEACAHVLFDQLKAVLSFDGTYVDDRHIMLIVDTMCRGGAIMALNRHGINRNDYSPLMRCSFEETTDVLCDAAVFADSENARGVTTANMTGQLAQFGTGASRVLFRSTDEARVSKACVKSERRVMRSSCRSYVPKGRAEETMEYVFDDETFPRSHVADREVVRTRVRFRPVSPTAE